MKIKKKSTWLKNRGYLHLTNQIDAIAKKSEILGKVRSFKFVSKHDFFPLIHTVITERRYKKIGENGHSRSHTNNAKPRPLHYATHIDSMIFGYYAEKLQKKYLRALSDITGLSDCVTAYRRIEDPDKKGKFKSTIHFAHEVFKEIKLRSTDECIVLKFDIEKFFSSIDHKVLKKAWIELLKKPTLPEDHYKVFKAATNFSFINRDDLRIKSNIGGERLGFNEKKLADIRKKNVVAFFESPKEFREVIKEGNLRIHKNSFKNLSGEMVGIPQGLPISAVLANLYLLEADKQIYEKVVVGLNGFYRRYSDDIIVICRTGDRDIVKNIVEKSLTESNVVVSIPKTEEFLFRNENDLKGKVKTFCYKMEGEVSKKNHPLTYLGFEYYGDKTLIKSANLAKFYRRMIFAVKSRTRRAILATYKNPNNPEALFKRRLYRLYTNINLDKSTKDRNFKKLELNRFDEYVYKIETKPHNFRSNYFSYSKRAANIMGEKAIVGQLKRHRYIFNKAVQKHFTRNREIINKNLHHI